MGLFDLDQFYLISEEIPRVEDYFDFPSSLIAFGESLKSSQLFEPSKGIFFRKRNQQVTLITFFCSSEELKEVINHMKASGHKIKSLNFVNKPLTPFKTKFYMNEFWVDQTYDLVDVLGKYKRKMAYNIRRDIKISGNKYSVHLEGQGSGDDVTHRKVLELFEEWYKFAKERHFMVMRGHYLKYIERYFQNKNNVQFLSFWRKSDNTLFGISGYERFHNQAQLTIMKHLGGDYSFPRFFWFTVVQHILNTGVEKLFCGSTADDLKEALGFNKEKSYKIDLGFGEEDD